MKRRILLWTSSWRWILLSTGFDSYLSLSILSCDTIRVFLFSTATSTSPLYIACIFLSLSIQYNTITPTYNVLLLLLLCESSELKKRETDFSKPTSLECILCEILWFCTIFGVEHRRWWYISSAEHPLDFFLVSYRCIDVNIYYITKNISKQLNSRTSCANTGISD